MPLSFLFACSTGCSFPACSWGSFPACFPMALRCSTPAGSIFPMALRCSVPAGSVFPMVHPFRQIACLAGACCRTRFPLSSTAPLAGNIFPMALRCSAPAGSPLCRRFPACNSFATAPLPATNLIGAPASNKPHPAEKSTPVWLAIWRTWAGFANSQLRRVTFRCTYSYICTHPRYCRLEQLLGQTQIFRPICTNCLRHLRISAR